MKTTRVTILWSYWSGYMDASVRALVEDFGCAVTIVYLQHGEGAPYAESQFFQYPCTKVPFKRALTQLPEAVLAAPPPDILVINSWDVTAYRKFSAKCAGISLRVLTMDNQWLGTPRQWLGVAVSPFHVRPYYETVLLPGKRQADFARRLGFKTGEIYQGHYACDFPHFAAQYKARQERPLSRTFICVGRLVEEKGIGTLLDAWEMFVARGNKGWRLKIVGEGGYVHPKGMPSAIDKSGFVQPSELPKCLLDGDVFVSASYFEPWGLVVQEAASTGMPVICTDACGSGDAFVQDGESGFVVPRRSAAGLLSAFEKIADLDEAAIRAMGAASFELAGRRTPHTWAGTLMEMQRQHGKATI